MWFVISFFPQFVNDAKPNRPFRLVKENYFTTQPGISAYADAPSGKPNVAVLFGLVLFC